jgi:hypothetical protein
MVLTLMVTSFNYELKFAALDTEVPLPSTLRHALYLVIILMGCMLITIKLTDLKFLCLLKL